MATVYRAKWWVGDELITFLWRSLTRKQYRHISSLPGADYLRYAAVYRTSLFAGPQMDHVPAGIVAWIGAYELANNPFSGSVASIQKHKDAGTEWCNGYLNAASALISFAFGYKFEEIDEWDASTFFRRLAQAEYIMNKPLEIVDPKVPPEPTQSILKRGGRLKRIQR
jgi:hypothetical protein